MERADSNKALGAEPRRVTCSGAQGWRPAKTPGIGWRWTGIIASVYFVLPWQVPEQLPPQMQDTVPSQVPEQSVHPLFAVGVPWSPKTTAPYFAS